MSHQGEKPPARRRRYEKQRPTVRRALTLATGYINPAPPEESARFLREAQL
jgi:hypothetical protein